MLAGSVARDRAGDGADALVVVDCGGDRLFARITRHSVHALDLRPGRPIFAIVKAVTFDRANSPAPTPRPPAGVDRR